MTESAVPITLNFLDRDRLAAMAKSRCTGHWERRKLLLTSVTRFGNQMHVVMDSFMWAWALLDEANLLPKPPKSGNVTVVLMNERKTNTAKRNSCCISSFSPHTAEVGPWQPLFQLLSPKGEPMRTPAWLLSSVTPRCFDLAAVGGSPGIDYYNTQGDFERRAMQFERHVAWLRGRFKLPPWPASLVTADWQKLNGKRLPRLLLSRRSSGRRILNYDLLIGAARSRGYSYNVIDWAGMPFYRQVEVPSSYGVYIGIQGSSMFNAIYMKAEGVAVMMLSCACPTHSVWHNLLANGMPGTMLQYRGRDPQRPGADCDGRGQQPIECSMERSVAVPVHCFYRLLDEATKVWRVGESGDAALRPDPPRYATCTTPFVDLDELGDDCRGDCRFGRRR